MAVPQRGTTPPPQTPGSREAAERDRGRRRGLRIVLTGEILSMTGSQLSAVAMPWFALRTTGSSADMGRVMAAQMAAVAIFGVAGASLAGRLGPRRTMLIGDVARGPLVMLVPLLHYAGLLRLPVFMLVLFAIGSFFAPYMASQQALLPALAGEDEVLLSQANSMLQSATRFSVLLGPSLAGLLISWLSAPAVLFIDAASFLASALLLRWGLPKELAVPVRAERHRLKDAVQLLLSHRLVGNWTLAQILGETAWQALFALLPVLALRHYGGSSVLAGLLLASFGGGALAGALSVGRVLKRVKPTALAMTGRAGQTVCFAALLVPLPAGGMAAVLAVAGLFNGLSNGPMIAIRTKHVTPALRSAVFTLIAAASLTGGTLGLLGAGTAAQEVSFGAIFAALALLQLLAGIFFAAGALGNGGGPEPVSPAQASDV